MLASLAIHSAHQAPKYYRPPCSPAPLLAGCSAQWSVSKCSASRSKPLLKLGPKHTPVKLAARGQVPSAPARPPRRRYDDSWPEHKSPLHTQAPAKDPSTFQRQSMPQHPAEPHSHAPKAEHTGPSGSRTAGAHPEQGSSRHSPAVSEVLDEDKPQQEQGTGQGGPAANGACQDVAVRQALQKPH